MNDQIINEILDVQNSGGRVLFGRSHKGTPKIKVKHGVFGLKTKRYHPDEATFQAIKDRIRDGKRQRV